VQLFRVIDWTVISDDSVTSLLCQSRKNTCQNMMCSRFCQNVLAPSDAVIVYGYKIQNKQVNEYIVSCIKNASDEELLCYLQMLVYDIRYQHNSIMSDYLINRCADVAKLRTNFYWELIINSEEGHQTYIHILNDFVKKISGDMYTQLDLGHQFVKMLQNLKGPLNNNEIRHCINQSVLHNMDYTFQKADKMCKLDKILVSLPIKPELKALYVNIEEVEIKESSTKPIKIPCICVNEKNEKVECDIMYKSEDLRKDQTVISIIRLMDMIIKKELKLDLHIVTYNVRPTGLNNGTLEMVGNSETIHTIRDKMNFSILNYIMEHNQDLKVKELRDIFLKSTAAYCVITYLLGIGDRHLDNIMVSNDGKLFHVDFGFILGGDPKPLATRIRITPEMVDALGGIKSEHYEKFRKICTQVYNCLRGHIDTFTAMLLHLSKISTTIDASGNKLTPDMLHKEMLRRFLPGQNHAEAELEMASIVDSSCDSYKESLYDMIHDNYGTLGKNMKALTDSVYTVGNSIGTTFNSWWKKK